MVAGLPEADWSPEQISGWLKQQSPDGKIMCVSHETIYRSLFIQARGVLREELKKHLRTRRMFRHARTHHAAISIMGAYPSTYSHPSAQLSEQSRRARSSGHQTTSSINVRVQNFRRECIIVGGIETIHLIAKRRGKCPKGFVCLLHSNSIRWSYKSLHFNVYIP